MEKSELVLNIRALTEKDVDRVCELEHQVFPDPWPRSSFVEQLDDECWGTIVAEIENKIIGYACYLIVANEAHLTNIAVDPRWRRKSVAKRLLESILDMVMESRCEILLLEVRPSNSEARAFYAKHGFKELYRRPNYYRRPIEDALVLVRYFNHEPNGA